MVTALLSASSVAGATACSVLPGSAASEADALARHAGLDMSRKDGPVPVAWLAAPLGSAPGGPGEILQADGTNFHGKVVLRLTVSVNPHTLNADTTSRCYAYTFHHRMEDVEPSRVDCPEGPGLTLSPAPPIPLLGEDDAIRLAQLLGNVAPAQRQDYAHLDKLVQAAFGPRVTITSYESANKTLLEVHVRHRCLLATLPATGEAQVESIDDNRCTGG